MGCYTVTRLFILFLADLNKILILSYRINLVWKIDQCHIWVFTLPIDMYISLFYI